MRVRASAGEFGNITKKLLSLDGYNLVFVNFFEPHIVPFTVSEEVPWLRTNLSMQKDLLIN